MAVYCSFPVTGPSSRERIEQAKADWRAGRIKLPDLDRDDFIPLPAEA